MALLLYKHHCTLLSLNKSFIHSFNNNNNNNNNNHLSPDSDFEHLSSDFVDDKLFDSTPNFRIIIVPQLDRRLRSPNLQRSPHSRPASQQSRGRRDGYAYLRQRDANYANRRRMAQHRQICPVAQREGEAVGKHHPFGDEIRDERFEPSFQERKLLQDLAVVRQVELDYRVIEERQSHALDWIGVTSVLG